MSEPQQIAAKELVELCALDGILFSKEFFPGTARVEPPTWEPAIWQKLDGPGRFLNLVVPRGFAKTSRLRLLTARRICYGLSKVVVWVGKSEPHAIRSVRWLKKQIRINKKLKDVFGLRPGKPFNDTELVIINDADKTEIYVVALGITGSTRGINFDDYRPDLIVGDDLMDKENSATLEQRTKIEDLVLADLKHSLAPPVEAPFAKMVLLNTPQDFNDLSQKALKDKQFESFTYSCWTEETRRMPVEFRKSSWPALWSTEYLQADRQAAVNRNKLALWTKEMECELITPELASFREEWLQYWSDGGEADTERLPAVGEMYAVLAIDPVPPPSPLQIAKGFRDKDFEALSVVGRNKGRYFLCETSYNRGHDPSWTVAEFFRLARKWRVRKIIVEGTGYQRTLEWLLRQAMRKLGTYYVVAAFDDKRKKHDRVVDGLNGVSSNRQLYVNRHHHGEFIHQFIHHGSTNLENDDVIESVANAVTELEGRLPGGTEENADGGDLEVSEAHIPALVYDRGAP